jgi:hypothetical protein
VDDDAAAFRAFLDAKHGSAERQASATRVAQIPLEIGRACLETCQLVRTIEPHVAGSLRLDVATANYMAQAAARLPIQFNDARSRPRFWIYVQPKPEPRPRTGYRNTRASTLEQQLFL